MEIIKMADASVAQAVIEKASKKWPFLQDGVDLVVHVHKKHYSILDMPNMYTIDKKDLNFKEFN